ncbi:MAG: adenylyl-sulfate kinase [Alphaproteobacteria bacterium]|nr:adenylyl-sulfate kinase [Alphaproteobacteria bacterium]
MIVWLIGMSGAGKSEIGRQLYRQMKAKNPATVFVDGDEIREVFRTDQSEADYSIEGRRRNADRIQAICKWLESQNIDVVCCVLSIFPESLGWNRENFSDYFEVFVDAPMDDLVERNPKNLYRLAIEGKMKNVVGVDIEFVPPANPDMTFLNGRPFRSAQEMAAEIMQQLEKRKRVE